MIAGVEDEESGGIIPVTAVRNVQLPSLAETEEHNLTHLPFRDWCDFCVFKEKQVVIRIEDEK